KSRYDMARFYIESTIVPEPGTFPSFGTGYLFSKLYPVPNPRLEIHIPSREFLKMFEGIFNKWVPGLESRSIKVLNILTEVLDPFQAI
ncbi:MAG TPA: hypothetical protein VJL87_04505, partial [Bdellovibrionota bacterium]|nr:hypothetical protein [Bdellovibrionota bacterium]